MPDRKAITRHRLVGLLLWGLFGAGVAVQLFGPRLEIADDKFVVPPAMVSEGSELRPEDLVERERRTQWISLVLTLSGALGLTYYYRHVLVRRSR